MSDSSDPLPLPRPVVPPERDHALERLRTFIAALRRRGPDVSWAGAGFALAVLLGVLIWSRVETGTASPIEESLPTLSPISALSPTVPSGPVVPGPPTTVVVHVAGAVARPGVYELADPTRVGDAIEAAGGATDDADLDRINLAALVVDASQVFVPRPGESLPEGTNSDPTAAGDGGSSLVDLNVATATDLETLPGVGPVTAAAIISYRDENGGFATIAELDSVTGIGPARIEQLRSLVTVGPRR